jgi:ribosomal protein S18 acetylase RimI-like enzyme
MSKLPYTIRAATATDIECVAALWIDFMREHNRRFFRKLRLSNVNKRAMAMHLGDLVKLGQVIVLDYEGVVRGFTAIVADTSKLEQHFASATISDLYLAPELRGRGWGRALLNAATLFVRERGLHAATITVLADNRAARALYASAGFRPMTESLILPFDEEFVRFGKEASP